MIDLDRIAKDNKTRKNMRKFATQGLWSTNPGHPTVYQTHTAGHPYGPLILLVRAKENECSFQDIANAAFIAHAANDTAAADIDALLERAQRCDQLEAFLAHNQIIY